MLKEGAMAFTVWGWSARRSCGVLIVLQPGSACSWWGCGQQDVKMAQQWDTAMLR